MGWLNSIFQVFIYVIAANTVGAAICTALFSRGSTMSFVFLWQIILLAAVCAIGNILFYSKRELSKERYVIRYIFHYLYISVIILGGAHVFNWVTLGFRLDNLIFCLIILFDFCIINYFMYHKDSKTAEDMNRKLRKYRKEDEV